MRQEPERTEYGEYVVESFLGKGSIGKVWLARHRRIGRRVALKTVQLEQKFEDDVDRNEFYKRLQREAELCGAMQHPNIVTLYDVGYDGELVSYFATEFVDGETLLARLRRTRPLPLDEALAIGIDILRGLAYAHSKGIIHRDIKPANILLTADGAAKIADFGVARPLHSSLTATRSLVGTPNYMSPEQVKTTPVSPRSDLFSAGAVLYEMLTGVKPFGAPELSGILYNVVNHVPPSITEVNPAVPAGVARVVARLLEKKPEDRYGSAEEALADLEAVLREPETSAAVSLQTIAVTPHDATTPMPTQVEETSRSLIRRPVPAGVFWLVTVILSASLAISVVALRKTIEHQRPAGVITPAQRQLTAAKQQALATARTYLRTGRYNEAIAEYDAYLAQHPQSVVAREEREEAIRMVQASAPKVDVTRAEPRPKRAENTAAQRQDDDKKASRWERFKRWFRGSDNRR